MACESQIVFEDGRMNWIMEQMILALDLRWCSRVIIT